MTDSKPRAIFGILMKLTVDEVADLIIESMEALGIGDTDWDWILWSRSESVYAVISAPISAKGAVSNIADIKMLPVGSMTDRMQDNRNDWVYPRSSASRSALENAEKSLSEWIELQFIESENPEIEVPLTNQTRFKERTRIASRAEVYSKTQRRDAREQQRGENTAATLGLDEAKDSAGRGFVFKSFST